MSQYSSVEYVSIANMPCVCLTNAFIWRCGNEVYQVVKREILFEIFMTFWNIRIVGRYENGINGVFLSFAGLPGEQIIIFMLCSGY